MVIRVTDEIKSMLSKSFPYGDKWEKRKVVRVTMDNAWYNIGDIITVKFFATFGCYDIEDRWVNYYDLSLPIEDYQRNEPKKSFFKRIFK